MRAERDPAMGEPNILTSIWNHRLLVLACIGVFAALGVLVTSLRPSQYAAEAGVLLTDPASAVPLTARDEVRYIADQVAILKSAPVSERASALARLGENPKVIDALVLQRNTSIRAFDDSNFIVISFRARNPETAAAGANAIVRAYRNLIRADLDADAKAALRRLNLAISRVTPTLTDIGANEDALALLNKLRSRRTRLQVDAELNGDGVALFSPAGGGKPQGVSLASALAVSILLGGLIGVGVAYWLDGRREEFSSTYEPQVVLEAPALAEIPDFTHENVASKLPVLNASGTKSAEAFRFLASSLRISRKASQDQSTGPSRKPDAAAHQFIAFISASLGDGTTTLTANTAFAAAQEGDKVLAIDADVETHGLAQLLLGDDSGLFEGADSSVAALSDTHRDRASSESVRWVMGTRAGGALSLFELGTDERRDNVFRADEIMAAVNSIRDQFDLILLDVPPILRVAYADSLLRSADAVVVVVPHRSETTRLKHILHRLAVLGVRPIGYVYNFAPVREDLARNVAQDIRDRAEKIVAPLARARNKRPSVVQEPSVRQPSAGDSREWA